MTTRRRRWLLRRSGTVVGGMILVLFVAAGVAAPWLAPHPPGQQHLNEYLRPPGYTHPCGQDRLGRDICSRLLYGARVSLLVGVVTVAISVTIGLLVGGLCGYLGGWADDVTMRLTDVLLSFPGLLLAIAVAAVLGPSLANVVAALSLIGWSGYARLVRGEVRGWSTHDFVHAATALGATPGRVLLRHILPQLAPVLLTQASFGMSGAIVAEGSLSFLGIGVQPPTPSWGSMISEGRSFMLFAPHTVLFPAGALVLTVLALNLVGDGIRDALDTRQQRSAGEG